jgi:flagellar biosynthesis/type III secretory pathway M-ring protein FliF/YscJ
MNLDLRNLLAEIGAASGRTKAFAVLSALALVAALSLSGLVASEPHFVTLYSGLDDAERVAVERALAEGGVRFRASNFPGPYTLYVDEDQFDQAQIQVALAEALKRAPTGINTGEQGASTIFMSSGERAQSMLKREWQETEHLLAQFDFVQRATVTTSVPDSSPLGRRAPLTVSVALKLRGDGSLSSEQAENVARLVRFRFGVPPENVIVTDQSGRTVYEPGERGEGADGRRLFDHAASYDRELAQKVNQALERAFGADKAYVTVTSQWDTDQTTTVSESLEGEPRELEVQKTESRPPAGAPAPGAGGLAGAASNLAQDFGVENAAAPEPASGSSSESVTRDERTSYENPRTRTQTVRFLPRLARLSVGLVIDRSLEGERDAIRELVSAAVGLDLKRKDELGVTVTDVAAAHPAEESADAAPAAEESGPSPTLEMLLERGVEIAVGLAFVVLLFLSLRGSKRASPGGAPRAPTLASTAHALPQTDPELLARAQIEELVKSDPRRVGEILSRWAGEESLAKS